MDNHERELLDGALDLLHRLLGYADAKSDFRPVLKMETNIIPFPMKREQPAVTEKNDVPGGNVVYRTGLCNFYRKGDIANAKRI